MLRHRPLFRDLQTLPRQFDGFRVDAVGYIPHKPDRVERRFDTFNYSLILSGRGSYACDGDPFAIHAPCVITQAPGELTIYGPPAGETWEELFFILPGRKHPELAARGLIGPTLHHWPIRHLPRVLRAVTAVLALVETPDHRPGASDRLDHMAERVIMETLLPSRDADDPGTAAVSAIAREIAEAPGETYDFHELARFHGMSYSTFQRRWRDLYSEPPGQFLLSRRISDCCRMLAEGDLPVGQVGALRGFDDPAYFSRIFKQHIGVSPSRYRVTHRTSALSSAPASNQHEIS